MCRDRVVAGATLVVVRPAGRHKTGPYDLAPTLQEDPPASFRCHLIDTPEDRNASLFSMNRAWFLAFLFFLPLAGCSRTTDHQDGSETASGAAGIEAAVEPAHRRMPVRVESVRRQDVKETVELTGTAEPWDEFIVSPEISGRISRILVEEGDWVETGQVVVELDRELRLLALRSHEASLAKKKVELDFSRRRFERGKSLLSKGAISEENVESLDQIVQIAESEVVLAEIEVATMQEEIEDTSIAVQASGRVASRHVSLGETVTPTNPLFTIIQENPLKVITEIAELLLPQVRKGVRIRLQFDAFQNRQFSAPVHFVHPASNPRSGAFPVELRLPNPGLQVKPGMVARITMPAGVHRDVLVVPLDSLLEDTEGYHLFLIKDGKACKTAVGLERRIGSDTIVTGELSAGDQVVTSGHINLTDGTSVEVLS